MPVISEAFLTLFMLSIIIERSLAMFFDNKHIKPLVKDKKEIIALVVSFIICQKYVFDIIALLFDGPITLLGTIITALAVAGGSKVSIRIFEDSKKISGV